MPAYALTIFLGAFLLFQVQPLIAKYILPWFGGGPGVWTTCMLFFQVLLLGGYAYAHFSSRWLKPRAQILAHFFLLIVALALLPITPAEVWKPRGTENPILQILMLLVASLGLPYFVLASTGPLLQKWSSLTCPASSPYRLYALSNAGSLLALVTFPFYFETHFTRRIQAILWEWGLVAYVVASALSALKLWKATREERAGPEICPPAASSINSQPTTLTSFLGLLLPACASAMLLGTTNKICQDVAVIPFLWILPLALYLLSFIICFDNPRWYLRFPFTLALIAALSGFCWALFKGTEISIYKQILVYSGALFICCMVCHGELYRLKPDPAYLTNFYLMIAAGGALGGFFVAVIAPLVFTDFYELHCALFLCGLLFVVVCALDSPPLSINQWRWLACLLLIAVFVALDRSLSSLATHYKPAAKSLMTTIRAGTWGLLLLFAGSWVARKQFKRFQHWRLLACVWLTLGLSVLTVALWKQSRSSRNEMVDASRNFYGVLKVFEYYKNDPKQHYFLLEHGRITHGLQFADPEQAAWPTTYYGEQSGLGLAVRALQTTPRRIGLVGLGTGTITAYGRAGDYLRIYEINPAVERLATSRFTYLTNCSATVEVALGDARLSLEKEAPQHFDLLALDAFSSDAIPVHLLTKEAFETYARHLNTNGIIAVHISNHFLDLEPVIVNLARHFHYQMAAIDYDESESEGDWWVYSSTWILLSRSDDIIHTPEITAATATVKTNMPKIPLWTDDFASLFQIMK